MRKIPKYYRPAHRPTCFKLSNGAVDYIRYQAELHDVSKTFWLNMLLLKMCKDRRDFDPTKYKPTKDELKNLAITQLDKEDKKRHKKTGFAGIQFVRGPNKRANRKPNF